MEDPAVESLPVPEIPQKLYFRIGEVAKLAGIKPYVLRFWESEFKRLGPKKSGSGQRLYRRKDVELVLEIKRLLYEKRFTIEGAKKCLEEHLRSESRESVNGGKARAPVGNQGELFPPTSCLVQDMRKGLREVLALLEGNASGDSRG